MQIIQGWRTPPTTQEELWAWKLYVASYEDIRGRSPIHIILGWINEFTIEDGATQHAINIWIMRKDTKYLCIC